MAGENDKSPQGQAPDAGNELPLWEVFVQEGGGKPHEHVGSVHAADAEMALQSARDVFARRSILTSIWVVPAEQIIASVPEEVGDFFSPAAEKVYRHPQFYKIPKELKG